MSRKMAVRNKKNLPEKKEPLWKNSEKGEVLTARTSKMFRRNFGALLGVSLLIFGLTLANQFWSSAWPVKKVMLVGDSKHINEAEVIKLLSVENMGGMLSIDLDDLQTKLLTNPWAKMVTVRKQWPETLNFELTEFEPVARINDKILLESGSLVENRIVERRDAENRGIKNRDVEDDANLLTLIIDESYLDVDFNYLNLVAQAESIKDKLEQHRLELERFEIDETNSWSIQIANRFSINLGRHKQQQKMDRFFTVFAAIENQTQLEIVDLRYRNGLSVKYKKSSPNLNSLNKS